MIKSTEYPSAAGNFSYDRCCRSAGTYEAGTYELDIVGTEKIGQNNYSVQNDTPSALILQGLDGDNGREFLTVISNSKPWGRLSRGRGEVDVERVRVLPSFFDRQSVKRTCLLLGKS